LDGLFPGVSRRGLRAGFLRPLGAGGLLHFPAFRLLREETLPH
jgi:hypothetical protein